MNQDDFEGTLVLEKLARIDRLEEFMSAADSGDLRRAESLLLAADVDPQIISVVLKKMADPYDED